MHKTPIQIAFVAKEVAPAIVAALDTRLEVEKIVLLHSSDFSPRAQWLQQALQKSGKTVILQDVGNAFNPEQLQQALKKVLAQFPQAAFNLTCGTHLMTLLAHEQLQAKGMRHFYITPADELVWLHDVQAPGLQLQDNMRLSTYLLARGWQIESTQHPNWHTMDDHVLSLLKTPRKSARLFKQLAQGEPVSDTMQIKQIKAVLANMPASIADGYCRGNWLEHATYLTLKQLQTTLTPLQDILAGVRVKHLQTGEYAEFDVLVLYNNKLHVLECKTSNKGRKDNLINFVFKLDTLMEALGGQLTRGALITTAPLPPGMLKSKAKGYQIELIDQSRLPRLGHVLSQWLSSVNNLK